MGATSPRSGATADSSAASSASNHGSRRRPPLAARGVARRGRPVHPRRLSAPVGSAGTASPPGTSRSGSATVAAQRLRRRVGQQQRAGARRVGLGLLAEQPVGDLARAGRRAAGPGRAPRAPLRARARIVSSGIPSRSDELAVGAALAQDELHGGALVGRQPVERGGAAARGISAPSLVDDERIGADRPGNRLLDGGRGARARCP